jgi:hypothetical protein
MLDSVTMNAGMPTYATQKPCQAPIAAPEREAEDDREHPGDVVLGHQDRATAPTNAATDPTDRSMCRAMITITMPIARIRIARSG